VTWRCFFTNIHVSTRRVAVWRGWRKFAGNSGDACNAMHHFILPRRSFLNVSPRAIGSPTGSNTPLNSYSLFFLYLGLHPIGALQPFDSGTLRCASRYVSRQFLYSPDLDGYQWRCPLRLRLCLSGQKKWNALGCEGLEDLPLAENLASCLSRNCTHTPKLLTASARTMQISFSQSINDAFDQPVVPPMSLLGAAASYSYIGGLWQGDVKPSTCVSRPPSGTPRRSRRRACTHT
jgi:hypothetical protein